MKNLLLIFSVILSNFLSAAEYGQLRYDNDLNTIDLGPYGQGTDLFVRTVILNPGDTFKVLSVNWNTRVKSSSGGFSSSDNSYLKLIAKLDSMFGPIAIDDYTPDGSAHSYAHDGFVEVYNRTLEDIREYYFDDVIVGPCSIELSSDSTVQGYFVGGVVCYKIIRASEWNNSLPTNTVVIPSDSSGPVEIILESSEDMVNWNSANPGTYGASTNERFFRVRAVEDTE